MPQQPAPPVQPPVVNPQPPVVIPAPPVNNPNPPTVVNPTNNVVSNQPTSDNNSNSKSDARITQSPSSSLNAYQINSSSGLDNTYFGFSNKTTMPGTAVYGDISILKSFDYGGGDHMVARAGIKHTFGGKAKKLAVQEVEVNTLARVLSVCDGLGYFSGRVDIDFESSPHLKPCEAVKPTKLVAVAPPAPPAVVTPKNEFNELKSIILQQQKQLQQLQHQLTLKNGVTPRVGG